MIGLIGRKVGMTRIFTEDGVSIPVSVIECEPNRVTQVKTLEIDGYRALQVTTGTKKASRVNKPEAGHFAKAKVEAEVGAKARARVGTKAKAKAKAKSKAKAKAKAKTKAKAKAKSKANAKAQAEVKAKAKAKAKANAQAKACPL